MVGFEPTNTRVAALRLDQFGYTVKIPVASSLYVMISDALCDQPEWESNSHADCSRGETRTRNSPVNGQVLYLLSYPWVLSLWWDSNPHHSDLEDRRSKPIGATEAFVYLTILQARRDSKPLATGFGDQYVIHLHHTPKMWARQESNLRLDGLKVRCNANFCYWPNSKKKSPLNSIKGLSFWRSF